MMNGRGKSDSAIVAGKPTNKAGQPAAERKLWCASIRHDTIRRVSIRWSVSAAMRAGRPLIPPP